MRFVFISIALINLIYKYSLYYTEDNKLHGTIPTQLGVLRGLKELNIGKFMMVLKEQISFTNCHITSSFLVKGGNGLTGSIPSELGNLYKLRLMNMGK